MNIRDVLYMRNTGKLRPRASIQDKLLAQKLSGGDVITTATGNPVSIVTNKAQNAISTLLSYSPKQSGTGDPSPQNIRPIEGWTEANLFGCGKNLFDRSREIVGEKIQNGTGAFEPQAGFSRSDYIPVKEGATYFFKNVARNVSAVGVAAYDKNKTFVGQKLFSGGGDGMTSGAWEIPSGACWIVIAYVSRATDVCVNYPSTDTDYSPYVSTTKTTNNLGGTYYGFSVDSERGKASITWAIIDLGSINWNYREGSNPYFESYSIADKAPGNFNIMCEIYKTATSGTISGMGNYEIKGNPSENTRRLYVVNSDYTDGDTFKTAMQGKYCAYKLATPLELPLTPQIVTLLKGNNTIWTDADEITITYLAKK